MTNRLLPMLAGLLLAATLVLTGAITGFFYAYSSPVMRGLDAIAPEHAIVAMQGINATVRNIVFAPSFFGAPIAAVATGLLLRTLGEGRAASVLFLAAATYVGGAFVPTLVVNVPMNEALAAARVPVETAEAARLWSDYATRWTWWNTLRTLFSGASLLLVGLAIFICGRQLSRQR